MIQNEHLNNVTKAILKLGQYHGTHILFADMMRMYAIAISNQVDKLHYDEREQDFLKLERQYCSSKLSDGKTAYNVIVDTYIELVKAMETIVTSTDKMEDILGPLFMEFKGKDWAGQFFTPSHIADLMAELIQPFDAKITAEDIGDYVSMSEPCCGSGVMVLSYANMLRKNKVDYNNRMLAIANDVDITCVHMAYIQLSLYGIPAVVTHGNSLTMQEYSAWYTPMYILNGFPFRDKTNTSGIVTKEREALRRACYDSYDKIADVFDIVKDITTKSN